MLTDLKKWANACVIYCKVKPGQPVSNGLLEPIKTTYPFEMVGLGILGALTRTNGQNKYILLCIELFTS
jgi:hypothetical protein